MHLKPGIIHTLLSAPTLSNTFTVVPEITIGSMLSDKQLLGCIHGSCANNESRIFLLPYNIYIMGYKQLF